MKQQIICLFLVLISVNLVTSQIEQSQDIYVWPKPTNFTIGNETVQINSICQMLFQVSNLEEQFFDVIPDHIVEIINFYFNKTFSIGQQDLCYPVVVGNVSMDNASFIVNVHIENTDLTVANTTQDESYEMIINGTNTDIYVGTYVGLLRSLESLSQLFQYNKAAQLYQILYLPIYIYDQPMFEYRGIMIDTARHFLSLDTIYKTLDGMMYNKLNILHWHITDADSFPMYLAQYPEITYYGAYDNSSIYFIEDIQNIVEYAHKRGVKIMPEIDSPGHSISWAWSPTFKDIGLLCTIDGGPEGQLDPTLNLTYVAVEAILNQLNEIFPDNLVHFGGDEVETWCWDAKPSIQTFMNENNIANYTELEVYYRQREKAIWRSMSNKSVAYWANADINLAADPDDIVQWWGSTADLNQIATEKNRIILSNTDLLYLDHYDLTWQQVYTFNPIVTNITGTVIGAEACLWSEHNDDFTQDYKLWIRGSALAERLWNPMAANTSTNANLVWRLSGMQTRLQNRGLNPCPADKEYCARNPFTCYPEKTDSVIQQMLEL